MCTFHPLHASVVDYIMFCVSIWYGAWSHAQHDGMVHEYEKQARSVWHCTCNKCFKFIALALYW